MAGVSMDRVDLGDGHAFTWLVGDPATHPTDDARLLDFHGEGRTLVGIIEWHSRPDRKRCGGAVMFVRSTSPTEADRPIWQVHSLDPLHIEPSVHCTPAKGGCGSHGWIRDGRWVAA